MVEFYVLCMYVSRAINATQGQLPHTASELADRTFQILLGNHDAPGGRLELHLGVPKLAVLPFGIAALQIVPRRGGRRGRVLGGRILLVGGHSGVVGHVGRRQRAPLSIFRFIPRLFFL